MLAMRPIEEPDVVDLLNNGRFNGPVEGYILMDGPTYLGHALFRVENHITTVLDSDVQGNQQLDGIVRACIAAGENRGAKQFAVNRRHPPLAAWWQVFCKGLQPPVPVAHIFSLC